MSFIINSLKSIIKKITKLSRPLFIFEDNNLKFKINSELYYTYKIENYETKTRHDSYVIDGYTLKSKDLFLEYIHVDDDASWNGAANSLFYNLMKERLNIKYMEEIEHKEYENYEFITYKVNGEYILNFIYIYEINKDVFIIDKKAELYTNLLRNFEKGYKYNFELNKDLDLDINLSLIKENAIYNYFSLTSN